jgi:nitroreductase
LEAPPDEAPVAPILSYQRPVPELIRARVSVRSYTPEPLPPGARKGLQEACGALGRGPLGTECRFGLVDSEAQAGSPAIRLGAYGTIRGARIFLVGLARRAEHDLEDFGYLFEQLILKATELGLGTCWLGGAFNRGAFARAMKLEAGEILPAISPVGIAAGSRAALDRLIRAGAGSARRKPWPQLFFADRWDRPLPQEELPGGAPGVAGAGSTDGASGAVEEALEMVRLAPSASNRQPWRVLCERGVQGERYHFFLRRSPGYRALTRLELQRIDMGIAMAHFELSLRAASVPGRWIVEPPPTASGPGAPRYVASWIAVG